MKVVRVRFDEELLAELDATEDVYRGGRSAVIRRAVAEYLARKRRRELAEGYSRAYGGEHGLGEEFAGWQDERRWPEN